MEQYTSEQALNGILNILTTVVNEHAERQNKPAQHETSDLITELLGGVAAGYSQGVSLGTQIEDLAKGMSIMKEMDIDNSDAKTVASVVSTLGNAIGGLEFDQANLDAVQSIAKSLVLLGSIDDIIIDRINNLSDINMKTVNGLVTALSSIKIKAGTDKAIRSFTESLVILGQVTTDDIDNINNLSDINIKNIDKLVSSLNSVKMKKGSLDSIMTLVRSIIILGKIDSKTIENIENLNDIELSGVDKLIEFIQKMDISKMDALDEKNINNSIDKLTKLLSSINTIIGTNTSIMGLMLAPLRGKMIGRGISNFIKAIVDSVDEKELKLEVQGVAEIINVFAKMTDPNSNLSIRRMMKILTYKNGEEMGKFFSGLFAGVPRAVIEYDKDGNPLKTSSNSDPGFKSVVEIIKLVSNLTGKQYSRMQKVLTEENGKKIGAFFKGIVDSIPENSGKATRSMKELIEVLSNIGISGAMSLMLVKSILTPKFGASLNGFITALLQDMTAERMKDVKTFSESMKTLSKGIFILTSSIMMVAGGIALLGFETVALAMASTMAFTAGILYIVKKVTANEKDIRSGTKGLMDVAKAITILTLDVLLLTAAANMMDFVDWIALAKMAAVFVMVGSLMTLAVKLSKKWRSNGDAIMKTMMGISIMLVSASVAVAITTLVARESSIEDIALGIGMVSVVIVGAYLMIDKILKKSNRQMTAAIENLQKMVLMIGAVSLIVNFLLIPIGKNGADAFRGVIAVGTVVGFMIGMVKWLTTMNTRKLQAAQNTLMIMTGMLAVVSLVAAFILPEIGKNWDNALIGVGVVLAVMGVMVYMIKKLSTMTTSRLKKANDSLYAMTVMFSAVALVAAFVLPEISKQAGKVIVGAVVALAIIGLMTGVVTLISKLDEKTLDETYITLGVMTAMFTAISLIAAFILPQIGSNIEAVTVGGLVVMGVITLMVGMVWFLNKFVDDKSLDETYKTFGVLTVMLVAVSLIANYLFPQIAAHAGDVTIGGIIVLGIIGVMVGMVWFLNKFVDDKSLTKSYMTFAVLTAMLVAVSLIATYLLPQIAESWEEATIGAVVVLGIIAVMALMVWGLSKIDEKNLKSATLALVVMGVMLLGVSLITKELLIPIGEEWDRAALGGVVVLSIVALMTAIVAAASKINMGTIGQGALALVAAEALLAGAAIIINELLVPIGKQGEEAAIGGAVVLSTIAIMTAIIAAAGQMDLKTIGKGALTIAAVEALLWTMDKALKPYMELCQLMYAHDKEIAIGGVEIAATLTAWGVIMAGVGGLMTFGAAWLAMGAAAIAGIGAILFAIGEMLPSYIKTALMMQKDAKNIAIGGVEIAATLTAWGVIMTAVGGLATFGAPFIAMGAATITGIATILWTISKMLPSYMNLAKRAVAEKQYVKSGSAVITDLIKNFGKIMAEIGMLSMIPLVGVGLGAGAVVMTAISGVMLALSKSLIPFFSALKKVSDYKITPTTIGAFTKLFVGSGVKDADPNSIYGAIKNICDAMEEIGFFTSKKVGAIVRNIKPIFETIGMFINIIGQICSMKYVSAWNNDGTPAEYETISMPMFRQAGDSISLSFGTFLTELGKGLEALKPVSLGTIAKLAVGIKPVMDAVHKFTETVLSVLNSKIECEWDKEGNPIKFRKFDAAEFTEAASVIGNGFGDFLNTFSATVAPFAAIAGQILENFKGGITPVMDAVCKFTDTVNGVMYGREYTITENGKEVKKFIKFDPAEFKKAAETIGKGFIDFIETLYLSFKDYEITEIEYEAYQEKKDYIIYSSETTKYKAKEVKRSKVGTLLNNLAGIGTIIGAVSEFTNLILTASENKNFSKIPSAATQISTVFVNFVSKLVRTLGSKNIEKNINNTITGLNSANKLVRNFKAVYGNLVKLLSDEKGQQVGNKEIDHIYDTLVYMIQTEKIEKIRTINVKDIANALPYVKKMVEIAKQMNDLTDAMKNADMTKACNQFIQDIEILTQNNIKDKVTASSRALGVFGGDLKVFTKVVVDTEKKVIKFTHSMNKATTAVKNLDNAILKKEKARNDALKKFADLVMGMAKSVEALSSQIEHLDKNSILDNFKGIAALLEIAKEAGENVGASANTNTTTQTTTTTPATRTTQGTQVAGRQITGGQTQAGAGGNTYINAGTQRARRTMITFNFTDVAPNSWTGYMEEKSL